MKYFERIGNAYLGGTDDDVFGFIVEDGKISQFVAAETTFLRQDMTEDADMMAKMSFKFALSKMALQREYREFIDETLSMIVSDPLYVEICNVLSLALELEAS